MRFDAQEYVDGWVERGEYPPIHRAIADAVAARAKGRRAIDLGCCTGMLTHQLASRGFTVAGVDGSLSAIKRGEAAGVGLRLHHLRVTSETLPQLATLIRDHGASVLVARRCLPEILGETNTFDQSFAAMIYAAGIREVFLEGRVTSRRSTHRLRSVVDECEALYPTYDQTWRQGRVAYLEARC